MEKTFQALFDSRALDSLPRIEAEIEKLTVELTRGLDAALKAASEYEKVTLHIEGDVKDSNIIIGNNNQALTIYPNRMNVNIHGNIHGSIWLLVPRIGPQISVTIAMERCLHA